MCIVPVKTKQALPKVHLVGGCIPLPALADSVRMYRYILASVLSAIPNCSSLFVKSPHSSNETLEEQNFIIVIIITTIIVILTRRIKTIKALKQEAEGRDEGLRQGRSGRRSTPRRPSTTARRRSTRSSLPTGARLRVGSCALHAEWE